MNARRIIETAPNDAEVEIAVDLCVYRCCGGGWRTREGDQTYRGKVSSQRPRYFTLSSRALGRISQIIVGWDNLLDAQNVD